MGVNPLAAVNTAVVGGVRLGRVSLHTTV
jgi:hypothetical protein